MATAMKKKNSFAGRSEPRGKSAGKETNWEEISRPVPCYLVMFILSLFEMILAILLLPYNVLNRPKVK
jgi:hypothetical protein